MATSIAVLRPVKNLDENDVSKVARLPKDEGRKYLANACGWNFDEIDEDLDLRTSIHLDFLYGVIEFCAKRGFPWTQICSVFQLAKDFFGDSIGCNLPQAIKLYRERVVSYSDKIAEENLKIFTNHLFSTYMVHNRLYQYVYTQDREPMTITSVAEVNPPTDIQSLKEAVPEHIWEYQQNLQAVIDNETARIGDLQAQREELQAQISDVDSSISEKLQDPLSREDITKIIHDAAQAQCKQVEKLLQVRVEEKHEDLDFYFEKTSLPRPAELGPPPRTKQPPGYSAKSKISTKGGGKHASAKSGKQPKAPKH